MREYNELASWPIRAAAYLIDVIIPIAGWAMIVFGVAIAVGIGIADASAPEGAASPETPGWIIPLILAGAAIVIGYFVWWLIALRDGQTPGKKIVGIRVVRASGGETPGRGITLVRRCCRSSFRSPPSLN